MTSSPDAGAPEASARAAAPATARPANLDDREYAALHRRHTPMKGIELNPDAIERALYMLERGAIQAGVYFSMSENEVWPCGAPETGLGYLIGNPVAHACFNAQFGLIKHLSKLVGQQVASEIYDRVRRTAFEELERPLITAQHSLH